MFGTSTAYAQYRPLQNTATTESGTWYVVLRGAEVSTESMWYLVSGILEGNFVQEVVVCGSGIDPKANTAQTLAVLKTALISVIIFVAIIPSIVRIYCRVFIIDISLVVFLVYLQNSVNA